MQKFLDLSDLGMYSIVDYRTDLRNKLIECKRNLCVMRRNNWANPANSAVDNAEFEELKAFLELIDAGQYIKLFTGILEVLKVL